MPDCRVVQRGTVPQGMVGGNSQARPAGWGIVRVILAGVVRLLAALVLLGVLLLVGFVGAGAAGAGEALVLGGRAAGASELEAAGLRGQLAALAAQDPALAAPAATVSRQLGASAAGQPGNNTTGNGAFRVAAAPGLPTQGQAPNEPGVPAPPLGLVPPEYLGAKLRITPTQPPEDADGGLAEPGHGPPESPPTAHGGVGGQGIPGASTDAGQSLLVGSAALRASTYAYANRYLQRRFSIL